MKINLSLYKMWLKFYSRNSGKRKGQGSKISEKEMLSNQRRMQALSKLPIFLKTLEIQIFI
jgi:hypothetical protein